MRNPAVPRAVDDLVEEVVDEDTVIINKVGLTHLLTYSLTHSHFYRSMM
jgi:hypothetical protein